MIKTSEDEGAPLQIIRKVEEVNESQKLRLYEKIIKFYGESGLSGKTFAVWGLSFKPGTDDMREAPSIPLLLKLHDKNVKLRVYDPVSKETSSIYFEGKVEYSVDAYSALKGADALLLLTEWREFREPDFLKIKGLLKNKVIFDGRNQYSPDLMKKEGFQYFSIGKPNV